MQEASPRIVAVRRMREDGRCEDSSGQDQGSGRRLVTTWAVLVAAGRGDRLGAGRPKAFVRLGDLPLLAESLRRLDESDAVDGVVLVVPPEWEQPAILLAEELGASKVAACVPAARRARSRCVSAWPRCPTTPL